MKKLFLIPVFAIMALFGTAQTAPLLFTGDIDTVNGVSTSSVAADAAVQNPGAYNFYSALEYTKHDSANWAYNNITPRNGLTGNFTDVASGLEINTLYDVRHKTWNSALTDSTVTPIQTVRTKQGLQPLSIAFVDTLAALPNSGLIFSASAVNHLHPFAFGLNAVSLVPETDTLWNINGPTDTVHFLVDGPGSLHARVKMVIRGDSGTVVMASTASPIFKTPDHTGGMLLLDSAYKGINSGEVVANVTSIGNSGSCVLITKVKNSAGVQVFPDINQTVNGPGLIHTQFAPLSSNSAYTISQELLNGFNQGDTIIYPYLTEKVPAPAINAIADTATHEDWWRINIYVNTAGTYDSSGMKVIYVYQNQNGNWVLIDSIVTSIMGIGSLSFDKLNQVAGTTYTLKVQGKNAGGLLSNVVILNVHTKIYNAPAAPTYDDLLTGSQNGTSAMQAMDLKFYVSPGTSADFAFVPRDITNNHVLDTIYLAHGATQNLTFPSLDIVNLTGGHAYSGTVITIVAGGIVEGTTLLNVLPSPNSNAIAAGITKVTAPSPTTRIDIKGWGSGEGNQCTVTMHIDSAGVENVRPSQLAPGTYSGDIEIPFSFSNLTPGTEYKFRLDVTIVSNGNAATTYDYFRTDAATGIAELEKAEEVKVRTTDPVANNQQVKMLNVLGQVITEGEYQTVRQQVRGVKALFMQLLDKQGNTIPMVDEKDHTVYAKSVSFQ